MRSVPGEKPDSPHRVEGVQNLGVHRDAAQPGHCQGREPHEHDPAERLPDRTGTVTLDQEQRDQDPYRDRDDRALETGKPHAETFDRAWRMLRMRRILVQAGDGFAVSPRNRGLVSYYANSIAHLLGPFEHAVRERDILPAMRHTGENWIVPA